MEKTNKITNRAFCRANSVGRHLMNEKKRLSKTKKIKNNTNLAFCRANSVGRLLIDKKKVSKMKKIILTFFVRRIWSEGT
jgi:hypothetical protein